VQTLRSLRLGPLSLPDLQRHASILSLWIDLHLMKLFATWLA